MVRPGLTLIIRKFGAPFRVYHKQPGLSQQKRIARRLHISLVSKRRHLFREIRPLLLAAYPTHG